MLSLEKCYGDDELQAWVASFEGDVVMSPKFDGVACCLHYDEHGTFRLAATRGTGRVGDDVTANVRRINDVPRQLRDTIGQAVEVRGEVFLRLSKFEQFKDTFANPRNLTAGALKQKDPSRSEAYGLSFAAYDLLGPDVATESERLTLLQRLGFATPERRIVQRANLLECYRELASRRAELDFEIDGIVFKADRVPEQRRLGSTAHHPRYAIAYKFQGDAGTTVVRQLEWSVARTGTITPVALVDPVMLSGALVRRASLHHAGYVAKLGLQQNAEVLVTRRGGVIPKVEHVLKAGDAPFELPTVCPSCGRGVRSENDFLFCGDPTTCRASVIGQLAHFVSVAEMDGLGDRILGELYDRGLVRSVADLYRLTPELLLPIDRVGTKLAHKLVNNVRSRQRLSLETFLRALGINELSKNVSHLLAQEFVTLDRILTVTTDELAALHSVGPTIANAVTSGLAAERERIDELRQMLGIEEPTTPEVSQGPLTGCTVVFTGTLTHMDRPTAQATVRQLGGKAVDSITKATTHVVIGGTNPRKSAKQKAAEKLVAAGATLQVLTETEFLQLATST